jgi:3-mercaptopyruvate sulfurtransferase SseA
MRLFSLLSVALLIAVAALTACNSHEMIGQQGSSSAPLPQQGPQQTQADGARRITAAELYELWQKGQVLVVDTRGEAAFQQGHIPGAIVITPNEVLAKADQLPRNKMIVTYCT